MANKLYLGDCYEVLYSDLIEDKSIDFIYIDPPFFTQREWKEKNGSFNDKFEDLESYIEFLYSRIKKMKDKLKDTGVFCLHLDYRTVHYMKVECDKIFGYNNFLNEIIWHRRTPNVGLEKYKWFPRKHDTILIYSKEMKHSFKISFEKNIEDVSRFKRWSKYYDENFNIKWGNHPDNDSQFHNRPLDRFKKKYKRMPKKGEVVYSLKGDIVGSVAFIPNVSASSKEKVGYPTQKPLKLLQRIIKAFTNEGDVVADFFCGSGTTLSAAHGLGRKWIGSDKSEDAIKVVKERFLKEHLEKVEVSDG